MSYANNHNKDYGTFTMKLDEIVPLMAEDKTEFLRRSISAEVRTYLDLVRERNSSHIDMANAIRDLVGEIIWFGHELQAEESRFPKSKSKRG